MIKFKQFSGVFFPVLLLLLFQQCYDPDLVHEPKDVSSKIKSRYITLKELNQKPLAVEKLKKLKIPDPNIYYAQNRMVYDSFHDFYISFEKILLIESGTYHSIIFSITRNSNTLITENLVLSLKEDGSGYNSFLAGYLFDDNDKELVLNGLAPDLIDKAGVVEIPDFDDSSLFQRSGGDRKCYTYVRRITYSDIPGQIEYSYWVRVEIDCPEEPETEIGGGADEEISGGGAYNPAVWGDNPSGYYFGGVEYGPPNPTNQHGAGSGINYTTNPELNEINDNPVTEERDFGGVLTLPIVREQEAISTNCEELKKMSKDTVFTKNILTPPDGLKHKVTANREYGYSYSKNDAGQTVSAEVPLRGNNAHQLDQTAHLGGTFYGTSHIHPHYSFGYPPMFSHDDVDYLFRVFMRNSDPLGTKDPSVFFITLTVPSGTYALKIANYPKFSTLRNNEKNWKNFRMDLKQRYDRRDTQSNDVHGLMFDLLKALKKADAGVALYEAEPDLSNWKEVTLNAAENGVVKTPCN